MTEMIPFLPPEALKAEFVVASLSETTDWGLSYVGIPEFHKLTKGAGITVAVLDTGGPTHDDLNANLLPALNCSGTQTGDDKQGHGTHVAGIIAALQNGVGVVGVAPEAKVLPIKVLDDGGHASFAVIERGIREATAAGVDIINMSLGAQVQPPASLHEAIKEASAKGIILIAAAGNDAGAVNWPARYDEVIAVAAMGQDGKMARFSSRGDQIAVGAPGVNVYSTYLNNQYAVLNGTSQAAPFMAGVCALILAHKRANPGEAPITSTQDMLRELDKICDPAGRVATGKDGEFGFGIPSFANIPWK